ncbi:hypothetical protein [Sphingomonas oligoaromativorans]|uniref:hypothetical protein n=1 Tax=Sphingomonas oligoaromativorans TaxID=575322 RepID=UPI001421C93C|nr:hypothetical protein [Sphingomonas oligoaromativorans]NIJ34339.1 hypothetical protein [Sphingomonas oligoaromativorans]
MAAAAPIAIGLQVAGSLMGAKSQADAYNYNASVDRTNAQQSLHDGAAQQNDIMARARAISGDALAASAANGVEVGTGSALDALRQTAINAQFNALSARAQAVGRANAYYADAAAKKSAARSALVTGFLTAGAKALSGFGGGGGSATTPGGSAMPLPSSMGTDAGGSSIGIYGVS